MFKLSKKSLDRLSGVHHDLVAVVKRAIEISQVDFAVLEGVRTVERQRALKEAGASQTMNSRHIPGADGFGKAVDLGAIIDGQVRWDWPLYHRIADAMFASAKECNIPIEWGGLWTSFKDGPHFQLPKKEYP